MMNTKMTYRNILAGGTLALLMLVPVTSKASGSYTSIGYSSFSGHSVPRVQLFSFGISNPYSVRNYRHRSYSSIYGRQNYSDHHRGNYGNKRRGYKQGRHDGHNVNKKWLHRKQREHHNSHRSGHGHRNNGYHSLGGGKRSGFHH